ncbi:MAG: hypothetical protein LBP54_05345 [Campylobacteraceae bacterium]|nr:hypothetical protein [Campylobacteraceae bacterium]
MDKSNGRVNIMDLERVVNEYNKTIMPLPDNAFELTEIYRIDKENRIDIYIPLWTKEEGRSDLTLSLKCFLENNKPKIEIDDLRVL